LGDALRRITRALGIGLLGSLASAAIACGGSGTATSTPTPSVTATPTSTVAAGPPLATATAVATPQTYVIAAGDTLFDIAATFGVSVEQLTEANGIEDPTLLQIGQVLVIPPATGP